MKRIGIVVPVFPFPSETFIVTKVLGLIARGFEITIFSTYRSAYWNRFGVLAGRKDIRDRMVVSVFQYKSQKLLFTVRALVLFFTKCLRHPHQTMKLISQLLRRKLGPRDFLIQFFHKLMFIGRKIDILHVEFDYQAFGLGELKNILHCKVVLSGRGSIELSSAVEIPGFYENIFKYVDRYHFISQHLLNESRRAGLPSSVPVTLVEPSIDLSLFAPGKRMKQESDKTILISVGRLTWAKGYEFAIDAVALVAAEFPAIEHWIFGEGHFRDALLFAVIQHDLKHVVHFRGSVPREQVTWYLQRADIMIHAAVEEGFCNAVIEAQAMELPVVTSDAGGLPENVEDGVTGFVVPRRDSKAMAAKILQLIKDPELRLTMGQAGRKRSLARFNIGDQIDKFSEMYQSL